MEVIPDPAPTQVHTELKSLQHDWRERRITDGAAHGGVCMLGSPQLACAAKTGEAVCLPCFESSQPRPSSILPVAVLAGSGESVSALIGWRWNQGEDCTGETRPQRGPGMEKSEEPTA